MSLDEMQARCDAVTEGPLHVECVGPAYTRCVCNDDDAPIAQEPRFETEVPDDEVRAFLTFAAHARTDMPRLIAALRVAMEGLERANASLDETFSHFNKSSLQVVAGTQLGIAAALARVTAILEGK